ncbi:hypothetical protein LJC15_03105 [Desulfovibrio sp. OttesenSCG-928-G11]|nr:hypothetical protein [Desulfovibrio sp. OttesenSCG-928-G11]
MLNLLPRQRKAFRPLSGLAGFLDRKKRRRTFAACAPFTLALALGAAIFSLACPCAPALAEVVIQSNGKTTRLHDDGTFSSGFEPAPAAPPGADRSIATPPRKNADHAQPEALPYGIVPEVHIPWYPGANRESPITGPQAPEQGQRPPPVQPGWTPPPSGPGATPGIRPPDPGARPGIRPPDPGARPGSRPPGSPPALP